jgi:hypothetical protein
MGLFSGILKVAKPIVSAVTGNWASLAGDALSAASGFFGQERANDQNINLSREQMAFQERMSNTAHQREVKDLNDAGLNPMLSLKNGGASTPAGAQAHVENSAASASRNLSDATSRRLMQAQIENQESATALNSANAAKSAVEARAVAANAGLSENELARREYHKSNDSWSREVQRDIYELTRSGHATTLSERETEVKYDLDKLARKYGFRSIEAAMHNQEYLSAAAHIMSQNYGHSQQSAMSEFYKTEFGKSVAPYLHSAESLGRIVSDVSRAARPTFQFDSRYGKRK